MHRDDSKLSPIVLNTIAETLDIDQNAAELVIFKSLSLSLISKINFL
jgi:hypothetical protein